MKPKPGIYDSLFNIDPFVKPDWMTEALVKLNGEKLSSVMMNITDTENLFQGELFTEKPGNYEVIVQAFDPRTGNTGVDKLNFVIE